MENIQIAEIFDTIADILDIKGDNPFRIRSYRNAARVISDQSQSLSTLVKEGSDLQSFPGIGSGIQEKIVEIVNTGTCAFFEKIKKEIPSDVIEMIKLEGLGPKKVSVLYKKLGIDTFKKLQREAKSGAIAALDGFGEKTAEKILRSLQSYREGEGRFLISTVDIYAHSLMDYLKKVKGVKRVQPAGSLRRSKETIGDLDLLAICDKSSLVMDVFIEYDEVKDVIAHGKTKSSVKLANGLQVDLRVLHEEEFGSALHYFTGSKAHNIVIRKRALERSLKVSEYGVFDVAEKRVGGITEEEVFECVGLPYIEPELRENRGEIEAAERHELPDLVKLKHISGDLHMHTNTTDGKNTIEEMAEKAKSFGYEYIAITNHSQAVKIAGGLSNDEVLRHLDEIEVANKKIKGITILKGIEVDIRKDGTLDLDDNTLEKCDIVLASVHFKFALPEEVMTERIVTAMSSPYVNILAHPTGRLILERDPYQVNMEKIIEAACAYNVALEINAHPARLDLKDVHIRMAKEMGAKMIINTDAHSTETLEFMGYGVRTARRGWAEKKDILNTLPLSKMMLWFDK